MSNSLWYVAAAYGVIWVVLFVYLLTIHQRVAALRQQLEATRRRVDGRMPVKVGAQEKTAP